MKPVPALCLLSVLAATLVARAQPTPVSPVSGALRTVLVATRDTPRADSFAAFLERHFGSVRVVDRKGCDPAELQKDADVVVLDWPQQEGLLVWWKDKTARKEVPLGAREDWQTPVVLLGSAGLNLAAAWDVRGGFG